MGKLQMDSKLTVDGIIGVGVLATSLVLGADISTNTTILEPELYTVPENHYQFIPENPHDNLGDTACFPSKYDQTEIVMEDEEYERPEIEIVEIPVVKRMVFKFKKPVRLEFS